jgi:tagatose 1,6-diphosphate aldolase
LKQSLNINGVAIDAGSGLGAAIQQARGDDATDQDVLIFKRAIITELASLASTILVDANMGPDLLADFPPQCKPMMAYEADVYHISDDDRITVLPDHIALADFPKMGISHLKFFMYYAPDDAHALNRRKLDLIAQIGEGCAENGLTFLLEPLVYHPTLAPGTAEYARIKPNLVRRATADFARPELRANVLKVEIPVDLNFVDGFGEPEMSRDEALAAFRSAAAAAGDCDLVYLSAGVTFPRFAASLKMASEAEVDFHGFMCGRAIWSDGIEIFGRTGETGLREWLQKEGRNRLATLNQILE